jgi:hypothetical protein
MLFRVIFLFCIFSGVLLADQELDRALANLSVDNDKQVLQAIKVVGEEKRSVRALPVLVKLVATHKNPKVVVASINALGFVPAGSGSIATLKEVVFSNPDVDLVYASLLSLISISINTNSIDPQTQAAFDYANKHHRSDEYIADVLDRVDVQLARLKK